MSPVIVKLCVLPAADPVRVVAPARPESVPKIRIPVAVRSVEKVTPALVAPESVAFMSEVRETRLRVMEVDPVFPEVSVAIAVTVFAPEARSKRTFDQVPDPRVAAPPLTVTLATPPESDTVPEMVGFPLIVALLRGDTIEIIGSVVSALPIENDKTFDTVFEFPARSENVPLPTEAVTVPVDIVGVSVNAYPVELS